MIKRPDIHKRAKSQLRQEPLSKPFVGGKTPKAISWGSDDGKEEAEAGDAVLETGRHMVIRNLPSPQRSPGAKAHGLSMWNKQSVFSAKNARKVSFRELEKENKVLLAEQLGDPSLIRVDL